MQRLTAFLDERVDGRAIGVARIILGLAALFKGLISLANVYRFQDADVLYFPYTWLGFPFPSGTPAIVVTGLWLVFALFFMAGFGTRISGGLLAGSIFLVIAIDQQFYSNHLYLLGTAVALMSIAGAGARYSLDARLNRVTGDVPRWAVTLIMLQLTSVYLFAAITKMNSGFLSGAVMQRAFDPGMRERIEQFVALETLAWVAILTELFLAFAFWSVRGREIALPVGIAFHITNVAIMGREGTINLSIFALVMISMMVVFFTSPAPGQVDDARWIARPCATDPAEHITGPTEASAPTRYRTL